MHILHRLLFIALLRARAWGTVDVLVSRQLQHALVISAVRFRAVKAHKVSQLANLFVRPQIVFGLFHLILFKLCPSDEKLIQVVVLKLQRLRLIFIRSHRVADLPNNRHHVPVVAQEVLPAGPAEDHLIRLFLDIFVLTLNQALQSQLRLLDVLLDIEACHSYLVVQLLWRN